jgi:CheY-like chemotaxis protein
MLSTDPVKILLVDDQPSKLMTYEVILGDLGDRLLKANSGREALALLLKHEVAIVLVDVQMPELDGIELAAMIRQHPRFAQTAIIFVSAIHLSDFDRLKGYEAGGVDYVSVPVVPEVLRAKVRVFADLYRKSRALERLNAELEQRVCERTADLERSRAELQALNEDLEQRIEQRTREREQAMAQLFEAQKLDTIGQLTGGVAHDFNNLLMAMISSLRVLRKRIGDDGQNTVLLDNAIMGAERGAALTQRLLAFARRQELRPEPVELGALVESMKDLLARSLGPQVSLVYDLPPKLPPVLIDANQLELAILNLAVNARDSIQDRGVVTLAAQVRDGADADAPQGLKRGRYIRLSVYDTGRGMDETILARACEPFFTTKGAGKGTGLGLSMVYGLAAQSGGALALSSEPGKGARADVWIPEAASEASPRPQAAEASAPEGRYTILVVDDDMLVALGTAAMLEDLGHSVVAAHSGSEALEKLETGGIEIVLTDLAMPGMNGLELAARIRERFPDMPIILATGYAEKAGDGAECFPRLSKPYSDAEVAQALSRWASRRASSPS